MSGHDIGQDIMEAIGRDLDDATYAAMFSPEGLARHTTWTCEDGWLVGYTTERIRHGRLDGKFATMAWAPRGKGARSGKARQWERVYLRAFAKRKTARKRALELYAQHSPRWAARRG